jgi:hypothetical protein
MLYLISYIENSIYNIGINYGRHTLQGDLKRTVKLVASKSTSVDNVNFETNNNGDTIVNVC